MSGSLHYIDIYTDSDILPDFAVNEPGFSQRKKKEQKERKGRPVETAAAEEIEQGRLWRNLFDDFHRCLKKSAQKTLRLFHSYHRPDGGGYDHDINFSKRLRSTLNKPVFGPKIGEPLTEEGTEISLWDSGISKLSRGFAEFVGR